MKSKSKVLGAGTGDVREYSQWGREDAEVRWPCWGAALLCQTPQSLTGLRQPQSSERPSTCLPCQACCQPHPASPHEARLHACSSNMQPASLGATKAPGAPRMHPCRSFVAAGGHPGKAPGSKGQHSAVRRQGAGRAAHWGKGTWAAYTGLWPAGAAQRASPKTFCKSRGS